MQYQILIVDDEKLMRDALKVMISKVKGFDVCACLDNGEEAVEYCRNNSVDIIFMDVRMPGISGIDAIKAISELDKTISIYIISLYRNFEFAKQALSINVSDYLSKPVSFSTISSLLNSYQQNQMVDDYQLSRLMEVLRKSDYHEMLQVLPNIVNDLFEQDNFDFVKIKDRLIQISKNLLKSIDLFDAKSIDIETKFSINEIHGLKPTFWILWLEDVMDYAFRQSAILKSRSMSNVFAYIDKYINEAINISSLSKSCGMSQTYLNKQLKQFFCTNLLGYIHLRKIKMAKAYIIYTDMSIGDISFRLGYSESSYFTKVFKKITELTPQQYKNAL